MTPTAPRARNEGNMNAATAITPAVRTEQLFVRIGTASGVAGSAVDIVVYGRKLP